MKFKYIIAVFNIILVLFLFVIFLAPLILFKADFTLMFWSSVWPALIVLFAALAALDIFFMLNYRLFSLLEREDWPALALYLEQEILRKGRFSSRKVRLLITAYFVSGDPAAVTRLEKRTAAARPLLVEENAPAFGAARILAGDTKGAVDFLGQYLAKEAGASRTAPLQKSRWLRWYYGFALFTAGESEKAGEEFKALAASSAGTGPLVAGLSAYFLAKALPERGVSYRIMAEESRERIVNGVKNSGGWKKEAAKMETEVYAAVVKQYIDETGIWLFDGREKEGGSHEEI